MAKLFSPVRGSDVILPGLLLQKGLYCLQPPLQQGKDNTNVWCIRELLLHAPTGRIPFAVRNACKKGVGCGRTR